MSSGKRIYNFSAGPAILPLPVLEEASEGIREIARMAAEVNQDVEDIGARRLHTVLTTLLEDILFDAPDNLSEHTISVTKEMVRREILAVMENQERSRYVL